MIFTSDGSFDFISPVFMINLDRTPANIHSLFEVLVRTSQSCISLQGRVQCILKYIAVLGKDASHTQEIAWC